MCMAIEIFIDGIAAQVSGAENLLQACLQAGRDVPYFCWHPALGSVGACRQCAVKIFSGPQDSVGKIVMSCMTKPEPGMRVEVADPQAVTAREAMVEFVLANHPHDCPVCEVGGECHLQDVTVMTGHHARRATGPKRTHQSQNLGPLIRHEMNRCIGCYRCVRFYQDYAGGVDFGVFGTAQNVFFGRAEDGKLASPFAGNLVEVCPTGVFVDKPFSEKFRRKWDMRATPSVCPHCAVGCNISVQERDGRFRRVVNRFNPTLNGFFLCDRGRFGTGFLNGPARLLESRDRHGKTLARDAVVARLAQALRTGRAIGTGSIRASLESNFVLRALVGAGDFHAGVTRLDAALMAAAVEVMSAVPVATIALAEQADAVLVLGQDPETVAPRLGLALRQAAQRPAADMLRDRGIEPWQDAAARSAQSGVKNPIFVAGPKKTALDDVARQVLRLDADDTASCAFDIARAVAADDATTAAGQVANALRAAKHPVIVAGGSAAIIIAAGKIVAALRALGIGAHVSVLLPGANAVGLACMGVPAVQPKALDSADVIVLENDGLQQPDMLSALGNAVSVTCLDHIETATAKHADIAVAVASFADGDGMFVNLEGRVQSFTKSILREPALPAAWEILRDAGIAAGILPPGSWPDRRSVLSDMASQIRRLAPCIDALQEMPDEKPPGLPHRYSGRTAARAHENLRESKPLAHTASPYGSTMEGPAQPGAEPLVWAPGWNSGQAILRLPREEQPGIFLFTEPSVALPAMPEKPWPYQVESDVEEMSALAPAIIAWRAA
jgi:NADH-quinone oxidoreductase subunit G